MGPLAIRAPSAAKLAKLCNIYTGSTATWISPCRVSGLDSDQAAVWRDLMDEAGFLKLPSYLSVVHCWFTAGPPSGTVAHQWTSSGSHFVISWFVRRIESLAGGRITLVCYKKMKVDTACKHTIRLILFSQRKSLLDDVTVCVFVGQYFTHVSNSSNYGWMYIYCPSKIHFFCYILPRWHYNIFLSVYVAPLIWKCTHITWTIIITRLPFAEATWSEFGQLK